jgi:hypothetical protein
MRGHLLLLVAIHTDSLPSGALFKLPLEIFEEGHRSSL